MNENDVKTVETFVKVLESEITMVDETLVPLLREYLNNIRDIRMAMAREVREITQSSMELTKLSKHTQELREFAISIGMIERVLTPSLIETLKIIVGNIKEKEDKDNDGEESRPIDSGS
jgi:hypothetical protein